jgi:hypothetical protein
LLSRILVVAAIAAIAATVVASSADATTPLTKSQYNAMLKRANARVGKVESAAEKSLSSNATPARLRTLILAWASTETQLGRSFRAIKPPATAASGNEPGRRLVWVAAARGSVVRCRRALLEGAHAVALRLCVASS